MSCDPASWRKALKEKNWRCDPKDFDEAMEVQAKVSEIATELWGPIIGWKVALTSEESQKRFGGGPTWGPLFQAGVLGNRSSVELSSLSDPLLEGELFYCDGVYFLAFEIPDNRFGKRWDELNWLQLTADLAGSYKVVVGREAKLADNASVILKGPKVEVSGALNLEKVKRNQKLLEGKEGCKLLGTIIKPIKPEPGTYIMECCGASVEVSFI